jgi:hypothetical protein
MLVTAKIETSLRRLGASVTVVSTFGLTDSVVKRLTRGYKHSQGQEDKNDLLFHEISTFLR